MLKTFGHIALIFTLLVSTTGVKIDKHYCCGRLIDTSIYSQAESCGMDEIPGCCTSTSTWLQVEDDFQEEATFAIPQFDSHTFTAEVLYSVVYPWNTGVNHISFSDKSPPLIVRDIPIFVQSFLL